MTQDHHPPVAPRLLDVIEMRPHTPDAGDEQHPARVPTLRVNSPLLLLHKEMCQSTCVHEDLALLSHWLLVQGSIMNRIDLVTGALGRTLALPEDAKDHLLALLGWIGSMQVAKMTTFALIMVIR
jgi:hypothetical protein